MWVIFGRNTEGNRNLFIWRVVVLQMRHKLWCWDPMFKKMYLSLLPRSPWDFNLSRYFQKIKHLTQAVLREREKNSFRTLRLAGTPSDVTNHSHMLHISHWDSEKSAEKALQPWQRKPFSGNCSMNTKLHINIYIYRHPSARRRPIRSVFWSVRGLKHVSISTWFLAQTSAV